MKGQEEKNRNFFVREMFLLFNAISTDYTL